MWPSVDWVWEWEWELTATEQRTQRGQRTPRKTARIRLIVRCAFLYPLCPFSSLLLLACRGRFLCALSLLQHRFVFLVRVVVPTDPREAHLVDGAIAAAHPVARIRIDLVRRVVVPADDVQHRARRIDRRDIV